MKLLNQLERKYGKYAIRNLITYIVFAQALVYIIALFEPRFMQILTFDMGMLMKGQFWRVFTFAFIPPETNLLWFFFAMYFNYMVGTSLEHEWGSFKFNIYYLIGMLSVMIAAFLTGISMNNYILGITLFLAFARIFPEYELLIFFVLPVKVKYLAWISIAGIAILLLVGPMEMRIAILITLSNFIIFFGKDIVYRKTTSRKRAIQKNTYRGNIRNSQPHFHKCYECGRTEQSNPELEFRFCSKCKESHEYCMEHLFTHTHKG